MIDQPNRHDFDTKFEEEDDVADPPCRKSKIIGKKSGVVVFHAKMKCESRRKSYGSSKKKDENEKKCYKMGCVKTTLKLVWYVTCQEL